MLKRGYSYTTLGRKKTIVIDELDSKLEYIIQNKQKVVISLCSEQQFKTQLNMQEPQSKMIRELFKSMRGFVESHMTRLETTINKNSENIKKLQ